MCFLHYRSVWNIKNTRLIQLIFSSQSFLYSVKNSCFVTLGQKCSYLKMAKRDTIMYGYQGQTLFLWSYMVKNKIMTNILWYIDFEDVYAQKLLWTTILPWGDTNYLLPYKTNMEVVTKAYMGLNHSVYVALWLKTKFDGKNCAFVTMFVLDDL